MELQARDTVLCEAAVDTRSKGANVGASVVLGGGVVVIITSEIPKKKHVYFLCLHWTVYITSCCNCSYLHFAKNVQNLHDFNPFLVRSGLETNFWKHLPPKAIDTQIVLARIHCHSPNYPPSPSDQAK